MHIVRSDKNGDTTVVSFGAMRDEFVAISKIYDPEVSAVEDVTVLLFAFVGQPNHEEIALVVGDLTFTVSEHVASDKAVDAKTTRTYAVPDDAGSLITAFRVLDDQPYKTGYSLTNCDCDPSKLQQPNAAEWHLTVTGFPKLHSDLLAEFEWLGR